MGDPVHGGQIFALIPSNHGQGVFSELGAFACPSLFSLKVRRDGWMDGLGNGITYRYRYRYDSRNRLHCEEWKQEMGQFLLHLHRVSSCYACAWLYRNASSVSIEYRA